MTLKLSHLFSYTEPSKEWKNKKDAIEDSIDTAIANGTGNTDVLNIMRDLLQEIHIGTSMTDYIDDVNKQG
jgi:hypothetical protein